MRNRLFLPFSAVAAVSAFSTKGLSTEKATKLVFAIRGGDDGGARGDDISRLDPPAWQFQELDRVVGKDYNLETEVDVYDATHAAFRDIGAESRHMLDNLLQIDSGVTQHKTLIDFGCGTGTCVLEAAKRGLQKVHGVDVSATMLQMAQSKVDKYMSDQKINTDVKHCLANRIHFHHAGFLTYEHHGQPVDFVTSTYALHHLPDLWKQVALRRIAALMKPHGKLHLRDVILSRSSDSAKDNVDNSAEAKIAAFVKAQAELGAQHNDDGFLQDDAEQHFREEFSTYDWILEGMLKRAGFEILSKEIEQNVIGTYVCRKI